MYWTEQRKDLYRFLNQNPHQQYTAREIAEKMADRHISISTIYRNLSAMVEAGILRSAVKKETHEILYQYVDGEQCRGAIHMICLECGNTFHMDHKAAEAIQRSLEETAGFQLLKSKSVLYGKCRLCAGENV